MKPQVITVVGPTAVGKTELSVKIAKQFNGEIISGDSMQIYKGMDIGTAKVTEEEMQGIPHHLIDCKNPSDSFSVADFQSLVRQHISEITERNHLPIIAGGTGLYIQAALTNYRFADKKRDDAYQKQLEQKINERGAMGFYEKLKQVDPEQAKKIHPNNTRRLIRALEIYETTGMTMSQYLTNQQQESLYDVISIGLEMDRARLYERINNRVDLMMKAGLLEEVRELYDQGLKDAQSMKAIGYKEFIPYFEEEQSLPYTVEILKRNSRRYAKRQLTWFKNKMDVDWYAINEENREEKFQKILNDLAGKLEKK
ncbi:tRNA (adenosine(37)-N6)-dimethylallyltransferase MiaA [Aquibacillus sp. 3ASR75-11]|uniref:tRNA dimethylallyltransferase n=1 Tax=Terrihalobacillus insolitus TaxID=2950438 RepID=A0A9X3WYU0_9BACI|nr:tRNA (adenosine(37)-N6)-dimethylallyltransferase MiaA [Terrihalobacillus insolitus]MDC3414333.1 tRNA (adenosine(37)-N6)-dimethylallyltransferase MiaA [Terrihalobacillus insolitus]MDC3425809.1 tRNA (adenosine(37)-N6)-dimethylallyltransferase MiaA [Terrihalobacillus insolitus]